jgi:hypothetical protein
MKKELEALQNSKGQIILPYTAKELKRHYACYKFTNLRCCRCNEAGEQIRGGEFFKVFYVANPPPINRLPEELKKQLKAAKDGEFVEVPRQYDKAVANFVRQTRFAYKYSSKIEGNVRFLIQSEKR